MIRRRTLRVTRRGRARLAPGGFSLIELIVALVVLAAATAGVLLIFAQATARSADPQIRAQARAVAQAYMDEILLQAYRDPDQAETGGAEAGEGRGTFDDVWDYDELGPQDPTDQFGNAIAGLGDYAVTVAVEDDPGTPPAEITVTVTHTSARVDYALYGERAEY